MNQLPYADYMILVANSREKLKKQVIELKGVSERNNLRLDMNESKQ